VLNPLSFPLSFSLLLFYKTEILKSDIFMQISFGSDGFIGPQQLEIYFSISYFNSGTAQSGDKAAFRFALNKKNKIIMKRK